MLLLLHYYNLGALVGASLNNYRLVDTVSLSLSLLKFDLQPREEKLVDWQFKLAVELAVTDDDAEDSFSKREHISQLTGQIVRFFFLYEPVVALSQFLRNG